MIDSILEVPTLLIQDQVIEQLQQYNPTLWVNPRYDRYTIPEYPTYSEILQASERLNRFAPYLAAAFPETAATGGIIESDLIKLPNYQKKVYGNLYTNHLLMMKCDHALPVSGSIKARGGIYEILKFAESIALESGKLTLKDNYAMLLQPDFVELFSKYTVAVGSTGNLGLSIGIISAKLGFQVEVHMSQDARQWKKELLRSLGVTVVEYASDYSKAVEEGRKAAIANSHCHFVDDENSVDLFLGYAVAALRLKQQFSDQNIVIDHKHPLIVYLPCGVGGGPGGVAFGLKSIFGPDVHIVFAEPTHSPCMLLGLHTGLHNRISVQDIGIDNLTDADGLAVGRPSGFVGKTMCNSLAGVYTLSDEEMYRQLALLNQYEGLLIEPSAAAGTKGPHWLMTSAEGQHLLKILDLAESDNENTLLPNLAPNQVIHLIWTTGGGMVPQDVMAAYLEKGQTLNAL